MRLPKFQITRRRELDPEIAANVAGQLLQIPGMQIKKDELYEMVGFTPPTKEDKERGNVIAGQEVQRGF